MYSKGDSFGYNKAGDNIEKKKNFQHETLGMIKSKPLLCTVLYCTEPFKYKSHHRYTHFKAA
jgi:hypothetical protein